MPRPCGYSFDALGGAKSPLPSSIRFFSCHTQSIWAIFSSNVMRLSRSSTRFGTGALASLYTGRGAAAKAGVDATAASAVIDVRNWRRGVLVLLVMLSPFL